jgi:hypothetical protein
VRVTCLRSSLKRAGATIIEVGDPDQGTHHVISTPVDAGSRREHASLTAAATGPCLLQLPQTRACIISFLPRGPFHEGEEESLRGRVTAVEACSASVPAWAPSSSSSNWKFGEGSGGTMKVQQHRAKPHNQMGTTPGPGGAPQRHTLARAARPRARAVTWGARGPHG